MVIAKIPYIHCIQTLQRVRKQNHLVAAVRAVSIVGREPTQSLCLAGWKLAVRMTTVAESRPSVVLNWCTGAPALATLSADCASVMYL